MTGRYTSSAGRVRGNASGTTIVFRWTRDDGADMGEAYVTLTGPGAITGQWCRGLNCDVRNGNR